ncbi:hypothetical protein, partial [uncultured Sulfurimonas sp.]
LSQNQEAFKNEILVKDAISIITEEELEYNSNEKSSFIIYKSINISIVDTQYTIEHDSKTIKDLTVNQLLNFILIKTIEKKGLIHLITSFTKRFKMKRFKAIKDLNEELKKMPSKNIDESKLKKTFEKLKTELKIEKDISILSSLYLQPFKLEYVSTEDGLKHYFNLEKQILEKKDGYCKLVEKRDNKLVVIKSFGKVSSVDKRDLNMLLLLVRLTQYFWKNRELYSLEISMLQLLK